MAFIPMKWNRKAMWCTEKVKGYFWMVPEGFQLHIKKKGLAVQGLLEQGGDVRGEIVAFENSRGLHP